MEVAALLVWMLPLSDVKMWSMAPKFCQRLARA
jgi:hypothetical protein